MSYVLCTMSRDFFTFIDSLSICDESSFDDCQHYRILSSKCTYLKCKDWLQLHHELNFYMALNEGQYSLFLIDF